VDDSSRAYAGLVDRFDYLDPSVALVNLIDRVDASALPALLAQFHVDFFPVDGGEELMREKIKGSVDWHRRKGTPDAVAELIQEMTGLVPTVKERKYFVIGQSALDLDEISKPPAPGFQIGLSQLDIHGLGLPDKWHLADVVLSSSHAQAQGVTATDVDPLVQAVKPVRTWHTTRFSPMLLGHADYGRLCIDHF
jgi:hypothetical protein